MLFFLYSDRPADPDKILSPQMRGRKQCVGPGLVARPDDRANYSKRMDVPVETMNYSDFIKNGRWDEVDESLRAVYREASEVLGREFPYPEN